jgi:hypothetical protein
MVSSLQEKHDAPYNTPYVEITKPRNGIYFFNIKIIPILGQIVICPVTVEVEASEDITHVEFMVPPKVGCRPVVLCNDSVPPFSYYWNESHGGLKDKGFVNMMIRGYNASYFVEDDIFLIRIII